MTAPVRLILHACSWCDMW